MAQAVIELLKLSMSSRQGNAEGGFVPGTRAISFAEYFFQTAPVEYAGELVGRTRSLVAASSVPVPLIRASSLHLLLGDAQFVARALGVDLDIAVSHDLAEYAFQFGDVWWR